MRLAGEILDETAIILERERADCESPGTVQFRRDEGAAKESTLDRLTSATASRKMPRGRVRRYVCAT